MDLKNLIIGDLEELSVFYFQSYQINISELSLNPHLFQILKFILSRIIDSTLEKINICIVEKLVSNVSYDRCKFCDFFIALFNIYLDYYCVIINN